MVEQRLMTEEEQVNISLRAIQLEEEGKVAEAEALLRTKPFQPWAAAFIKKYIGLDALLSEDRNWAAVEQAYGKEFFIP
jgi:hypothetical protein